MPTLSNSCLIGIPDHQGVQNVGGRIGAALGPDAFRRLWRRFKSEKSVLAGVTDIGDVGNLSGLTRDIDENHRQAAQFIARAHATYGRSIVIGGGHDHGFSQLWGIRDALQAKSKKKNIRLGCINLDAHLDVRTALPKAGSGSPFYLAIETGVLTPERLIEFGIQSHCNSPELWQYVKKKKISVIPWPKLRSGEAARVFKQALTKLSQKCDAVVVSLDLDSLAEGYCPGVSAPQAEGFTSREIIEMMEISGREKKVISLGIFELNPLHDVQDRTARLAATAGFHFIEARLRD